jgi:hypothetical protein
MGEVTDIIEELYLNNPDFLEPYAEDVSHELEDQIKDVISPGQVGYDTGHLHDTIQSDYSVGEGFAVVMAWYSADYGQYWYRWIGGEDFMKEGLEATMKLYGG